MTRPSRSRFSRRGFLALSAATLGVHLSAAAARAQTMQRNSNRRAQDVIVAGAGVFGTWTAWRLLQAGKRVLLLDAWGPGHARASSGGESRMTRTAYGRDEIYTRFAWESLED